VSKFDGKFRKNKDYQEDNEIASNFVKIHKRKKEDSEMRKVKTRNYDNNHKRYGFQDGWDG
jgi:hypothetical protein